jgi:4-hydroxy-2,2'-bipyrrole-5-carbaldehyde O-methyltransferase
MKLTTLISMLRSGQLNQALALQKTITEFYRACFLAAALNEGLLQRMAPGPASLESLQQASGSQLPAAKLAAWLEVGVALGELRHDSNGYTLRGRLARRLVQPDADPQRAILQEIVILHHNLLTETPARLRQGRLLELSDSDGELIARSSRLLEPLVCEAVDAAVPAMGPLSLLEVGCGSGIYIRHACRRNPQLTALGLELQPQVAEFARANLAAWGLAERVSIETGDIRGLSPAQPFDLLTLHNNIYYFPRDEWPALLLHLKHLLRPGGRLLLTTSCLGGSAPVMMLNLWGEMTAGCGPLPDPQALAALLRAAGFDRVQVKSLLPGQSFYMFLATQP